MSEEAIGHVGDFFAYPVVAGIGLTGTLTVGDKIHIKGNTTDMEFTVSSMQIDNTNVRQAKTGNAVGIKVKERVRMGDTVYKATE